MRYSLFPTILVLAFFMNCQSLAKTQKHERLVSGLIAAYYPNVSSITVQKKVDKGTILKNLKNSILVGENQIIYTTSKGKVSFWLNKRGYLASVRFNFKVDESQYSQSEKSLISKYKIKLASPKYRKNAHSNISQISDEKEMTGISVFYPNSDAKEPRITELFLAEGFFD